MQHVSDDVLAGALCWLLPAQLQAAGAQRRRFKAGGGLGQVGPLDDGEAGAGLVGPGAVLGDALVDGLVLGRDACDGQSPEGAETNRTSVTSQRSDTM